MKYKDIINRILLELPLQVEIIQKSYAKILDREEYQHKLDDLKAYEKRMVRGMNFLNKINDANIISYIENIRDCSDKLMIRNRDRYLLALKEYRKKNGIDVNLLQVEELVEDLKTVKLFHTTANITEIKKHGIKTSF